MIDVSNIIHDPDFAQNFSIIRVVGSYVAGKFVTVEQLPAIPVEGIVIPAKNDMLKFLPEGTRLDATQAVYAEVPLLMGTQDGTEQPDIIVYAGEYYRVGFQKFYAQCNLWFALVVRFQRVA